MKKILILLALILVGGAGYYFGFGAEKATEALKAQVEIQLQTLQKNGFAVEDRKIEAKKEHFVLHYSDPARIGRYFRSKNIDLSNEDAEAFKGLKIGIDLAYLDGVYSAVSADLYPVAFPLISVQEATPGERIIMERIIREKIFLAHIDVNKIFTAFKGHLKDIDTTFKSVDPITMVSKGFKFDGTYDEKLLTSSSNTIKHLSIATGSGTKFILEKLEGKYEQEGKSSYDFTSKHKVEKLLFRDEIDRGITLKKLTFKASGKAEKGLASSRFDFNIKSADINEPLGKHLFEDLDSKVSLENISIAALEKMEQLDPNDEEGFNEAFKELLAEGIVLKADEFSVKKVKDTERGKMIDGFDINAVVKINKVTNFKELEENPFALLNIIDSTMHLEFSKELYLLLQKRPELAIAMILFAPVSKGDKMLFDIEYKHGDLKINGQSAL
ncbi:MAG: DUF945 family protein [Campylobacterota bacterium]|nr:DUF945 family protein [Campylobacterota bacterium]